MTRVRVIHVCFRAKLSSPFSLNCKLLFIRLASAQEKRGGQQKLAEPDPVVAADDVCLDDDPGDRRLITWQPAVEPNHALESFPARTRLHHPQGYSLAIKSSRPAHPQTSKLFQRRAQMTPRMRLWLLYILP